MTDLPGGAGERGPLPPHERAWRHPSELAAPALEPTSRGGRVLIISTATISLLLVGMLALLMTPDRVRNADGTEDAQAIVTDFVTFAPAAGSPGASSDGAGTASPATSALVMVADTVERAITTPAVTSGFGNVAAGERTTVSGSESIPVVSLAIASAVVVTPIGDGLAVTTESAIDGDAEVINAVLPSGEAVLADVVVVADGVVFVAVDGLGDDLDEGMALAGDVSPTDVLYLDIDGRTVPVDSRAMAAMSVPEATPVLDAHGDLVGLCTYGADGIEVVPVGTVPEVDPTTSSAPIGSSTPVESAVVSSPATATTSAPTEPVTSGPEASVPAVTTAAASSTSTSTSTPQR